MARIYQLPSHSQLWLTLSVILACLPQLVGGPVWQWGLLLVVLAVREGVSRQRMSLPPRWLRAMLLAVVLALTWGSYGRLYGPDAGVALLVSLFLLKYLELIKLRDAYVLIVLGYFVCATGFLFYQSVWMAIYIMACLLLFTACLAGINSTDNRATATQHVRRAAMMTMQAMPIMVVLFLLVPRLPPLWNMNIDSGAARTGMSDSMSPGQISALSRSSEVAFRVSFDGPRPAPQQRYWRGLTFSHFDGTTWSQALPRGITVDDVLFSGGRVPPPWFRQLAEQDDGEGFNYQVIMEPTQRRWMYALAVPMSWQTDAQLASDFRLVSRDDISERRRYTVYSSPAALSGAKLTPAERQLMLSLPDRGGDQARELARQWRQDASSDREVVDRALAYFNREAFFYTLTPPVLRQDSIDQFLFSTRAGFCEHYASSFTFLMRAAGIPARVVAGYQGGELNTLGDHLIVRQYDAHAWSEVWLDGQGWVEVDPTAAVAPERIEMGLSAALDAQGQGASRIGLNLEGFDGMGWLGQLNRWQDYLDYRWQSWVLGYDNDMQLEMLGRWLDEVTPLRLAILMLLLIGGVLGLLLLFWLLTQTRQRREPLHNEFWRLHQLAEQRGETIGSGCAPSTLSQAIAARWPEVASLAQQWRELYERQRYAADGDGSVSDSESDTVRQLRRLRRQMKQQMRPQR